MADILRNNLIQLVEKSFLSEFENCHSIEVGLSGGKDSVALLDVLYKLKDKYKFNLSAVHVNHNLHVDSNKWSLFCQDLCNFYQIKLRIEQIHIDINSKLGIEAVARKFRYYCFLKTSAQVISLAHHQDDQIETYFLSILRGGDLRGLVSMPVKRNLSKEVVLWRPFLNITREDIEVYNKKFNLNNIEDFSNNDIYFLRNWVRHELIPFIEKKVPNLSAHIIQSVKNLQHYLEFIDITVNEDYKKVFINSNKISILKLILLPISRQKELLKSFIVKNQLGTVHKKWLNILCDEINNDPNKSCIFNLKNADIYLYNTFLWIWCKNETLRSFIDNGANWNKSYITWQVNLQFGLSEKFLQSNWSIRSITKNDFVTTEFGNKKAYKFLQEKKIPPFLRKNWPVIVDENNICIVLIGIIININYIKNTGFVPKVELIDSYFTINSKE